MSRVTITSSLNHQETGLNSSSSLVYTANEDLITAKVEAVLNSPVTTVDYGDVITPKYTQLRLISGDDVEISLDSGSTWPLRLSGDNDNMLLRQNNTLAVEISSVTVTGADSNGSLSGKYFDAQDKDGTVRAYFDVPERAEVSTITSVADTAGSLDGKGFILYDGAGSVGVWFDHGDSGTAAPADVAACARTLEITSVSNGDTAATVAAAIQAVLNADSAFSASVLSNVVTVTNAVAGARTDIADSASAASGFAFAVTVQGITAVVTPATPGGGRLLVIPLAANSTVAQVAAAISNYFNADSQFSATNNGVSLATIVDAHVGNRTDIVDGTTGFTIAKVQDGASAQVIQIRAKDATGLGNVLCTTVPE